MYLSSHVSVLWTNQVFIFRQAIVSFIWALTNLLGGIFMPSLFHPSRFWMVKVLVSMIVTAGSWVSFGGLIERISGSVHRGLFLCLLIPLA